MYEFDKKTAEEVQRKYMAEPLNSLGEGCVITDMNRTYRRAKGTKSFYDATMGNWVISEKHILTLKYALSEFGDFIVEVFEVETWFKTKHHNGKDRWAFMGKQGPHGIRS